eukprot:6555185-Prymnesium_polylepis.1
MSPRSRPVSRVPPSKPDLTTLHRQLRRRSNSVPTHTARIDRDAAAGMHMWPVRCSRASQNRNKRDGRRLGGVAATRRGGAGR